MKKKDLMRLIESENRNKKNLSEDFYVGEMDEDFEDDMMSDFDFAYDETESEPNSDEEDYEEYGMPPSREDDDTPRPRNKMSRLSRRMNDPFAPTIEPGIKEPKIKPIEPDRAPEWEPDFDEPIVPDEDTETEPQARDKRNKDFMRSIREEFNRSLNKLDNVSHKPIKYRKY